MKRKMKKVMVTMTALAAMMGMLFLPERAASVHAEETGETAAEDAGGTRGDAKEIALGQTYSETTNTYDDEDYFKFTTTEHGYFQVELAHNAADVNNVNSGWDVQVLDEDGNVLTSTSGITDSWTSIVLPYAEADKDFYVKVFSSYKNSSMAPIYCIYDLNVNQTATETWEAEPNDAKGTATEIEAGKIYNGITVNYSDEDFFKFTTTEHGYFQVEFAHNAADIYSVNCGWSIQILNADGEVITSGTEIKTNWTSIILPYAEAGKDFYIQAFPSYKNSSMAPIYCVYDLKVSQIATETWEAEPNDVKGAATAIETGKTYNGITVNEIDEDYFKFTTSVHGCFQVQLMQNNMGSGDTRSGWSVQILNAEGEVITSAIGIKTNWTSIILPYAQTGRDFYVKVFPSYKNSSMAPIYCVYDLKINQTATEAWEAEPNNTKAAATAIRTGKTYNGITVNEIDEDCFKFTTDVQGYFQVQLAQNNMGSDDTKSGWSIRVLNADWEVITSSTGIKTNWTSVILPYAQAGKDFYIQVFPSYENSSMAPRYCIYDLTVKQTATDAWEAEPNGTTAEATSIQSGKTYNGITLSGKDDDYYKINAASAGKLIVRLNSSAANHPDNIHYGWNLYVYNSKLGELSRMEKVTTSNSVSLDVKKGTYFIRVLPAYSSSSSAPVSCIYDINAAFAKAPAKPKISSVKAAKKAAAVKWKKVSNADGYYIYRSTSKKGEYKKVKTIKKASTTSWKNKKLKSGTTYYYKVAAYKKVNGTVVTSACSAVKKARVK